MTGDLERLIGQLPVGALLVTAQGAVRDANPAFEKTFGVERAKLIGRSLDGILESASWRDCLRQVTSSPPDSPCSVLTRLFSDDGSAFCVEVTASVLADDGGEILAVVHDVSEWDRALKSLREGQEINKAGTWSFDLQSGEVWWSPELYRIFGLAEQPVAPPYETHSSLFTSASWHRLEPAVAAAAERGTPYELQLELARTDGERRFAVARCEPQRDERGGVSRLIGTFQDVTELVLAQVEADQLLDRLLLAKSAAGLGIWEWSPETGELVWDDRMHELYGIDEPVATYSVWRSSVLPEDLEKAEPMLSTVVETTGVFKHSFRINRRGEIRHIFAVAGMSGDKMIGVNMDVTEDVRRREESRRMNNLESLGVLAGGIAHDFNNHLSRISAEAELLALRSDDAAYVSDSVQRLQLAVESAASLNRQLLTFSKGGAPVRESASIADLVRRNVEFASRGTAIGVAYDFAEGLLNIDADHHQIGQVIQNLVINAAQAIGESGGEIRFCARNAAVESGDGAGLVELIVEDNGPGIPEALVSRIFEPYFTTRTGGHGLGLSICHSIVQQHGGQISVTSTEGEGARFRILLPATRRPASDPTPGETIRGGSGRVLVVDDMPEVLELTAKMAASLGYQTETASTVADATFLFRRAFEQGDAFEIVITDLTMPGSGGGVELLENVRALDPTIRVVVASGYADDASFAYAQHIGFDARLSKPFRLAELDACLRPERAE